MKKGISFILGLIVIFSLAVYCYAGKYRCDRATGTKVCVEAGHSVPYGANVTTDRLLGIDDGNFTQLDAAPYPCFARDYEEIDYTAVSQNSTLTVIDCAAVWIKNRGAQQIVYLQSLSNPYPMLLDVDITIEVAVGHRFNVIYFTPVSGGTDGNVTVWSFK